MTTSAPPRQTLIAPFPWFGGKKRAAPEIWRAFGDVDNYAEPFAGSLATLLARPVLHLTHRGRMPIETVNDIDGFISNFWRSVGADPEGVLRHCDLPVNETDLHARHRWLVDTAAARLGLLASDPEFYDARVAGWWVWGISAWIGSGWCDRRYYKIPEHAGRSIYAPDEAAEAREHPLKPAHQMPSLGDYGRGVHRTGDASPAEQLPRLSSAGQGVGRSGLQSPSEQLPMLSTSGQGVSKPSVQGGIDRPNGAVRGEPGTLRAYIYALQARLRYVRVCCGDFERILGPSSTTKLGTTGVLLDPPYDTFEHVYGDTVGASPAARARAWAIENGEDPKLRIALCGYADPDADPMPESWTEYAWKARGGYAARTDSNTNATRERIWFSPHCIRHEPGLFDNPPGA